MNQLSITAPMPAVGYLRAATLTARIAGIARQSSLSCLQTTRPPVRWIAEDA
jgi:hypothetical protein